MSFRNTEKYSSWIFSSFGIRVKFTLYHKLKEVIKNGYYFFLLNIWLNELMKPYASQIFFHNSGVIQFINFFLNELWVAFTFQRICANHITVEIIRLKLLIVPLNIFLISVGFVVMPFIPDIANLCLLLFFPDHSG